MGFLTREDSTLYQSWFKEMARLRGFTVEYQYVVKPDQTIYGETTPNKLSDPITIDVIYEQNPNVKTLRNIGWINEDPNDKPYIMMLPFDVPNLTAEAVITVPPYFGMRLGFKERKFRITNITTLIEYPDCYICTLAPIVNSPKPEKPDYSDSEYNYIDSSRGFDGTYEDHSDENCIQDCSR